MLGTTNISTTLVGNELGVSTHNVGLLCTSDKINLWSRWKPVPYNKTGGLTDQDLITALFGLTLDASGSTFIYNYHKPTGSSTSPYRIGDFRNYDHYAKTGIKYKDVPTSVNIFPKANDLVITFENDPKLITLYDLKDGILANTQVEVLLYNNDSLVAGRVYRTNIDRRDLSITIPGAELDYFGVGDMQLGFYGYHTPTQVTKHIFPPESLTRKFKSIAETGIDVKPYSLDTVLHFGITHLADKTEADYPWYSGLYLDIGNNPFFIRCTFETSNVTIGSNNIYGVFEYYDLTLEKTVVKREMLYNYSPEKRTLLNWTKTITLTAGTGYPYYGIKAEDIPVMKNGNIYVNLRFYLAYKYLDGIGDKWIKINNTDLKFNVRKL